ncbi:unnamed protein product [Prorocentrum cordatum]|uniref:Secreted protein n=1 Tax=Prorocentrum cordatum TaxID=2364126 RepID=A0ABN9RIB4_9DINO|nr:unnamed protein product [Polarella glacialis]
MGSKFVMLMISMVCLHSCLSVNAKTVCGRRRAAPAVQQAKRDTPERIAADEDARSLTSTMQDMIPPWNLQEAAKNRAQALADWMTWCVPYVTAEIQTHPEIYGPLANSPGEIKRLAEEICARAHRRKLHEVARAHRRQAKRDLAARAGKGSAAQGTRAHASWLTTRSSGPMSC